MLIALRKHTKLVFWIIIALVVPAFILLYVPQYLARRGPRATYGTMFGKRITADDFFDAYRAERRAVSDFIAGIMRMEHRKPQNDFLRAPRDVILAGLADVKAMYRWRIEQDARERGSVQPEPDFVPLDDMREAVRKEFTDPETGVYDEAKYHERLRELGMTDDEYIAERRDNYAAQFFLSNEPLERLTWRRLVLAHEAERLRIPVSDAEVLSYLRVVCRGENGAIDEEQYEARLRAAGKPRSEYEDEIRTTIRITKLQRMVLDSVRAPNQEVRERFDERYARRKFAYHLERFEPLVEPAALRDDEVIAFYAWNRANPRLADKLLVEPKVAVMYVLVETKNFRSQVEVTDDELKEYHESHRSEFVADDGTRLPLGMCTEQVRAAVVERKAAKLARSAAARHLLVSSPVRLIEQAAKHGYEVRRTPLFGKEGPIDELIGEDEDAFRKAALGEYPDVLRMRPGLGDVVGPVKVKQGWCLISPTQIVPDVDGRRRPHYEVMGVARAEAARTKARILARQIAVSLYDDVRQAMTADGLSFVDACAQLEIGVTETGLLEADDEIPGLEGGKEIVRWAAVAGPLEELVNQPRWKPRRGYVNPPRWEPRDLYVREVDEGTVFFDVVETLPPDEGERAERLPEFAHDEVLQVLRAEAYNEWLSALYGEAAIVDLAERQRQAQLEAQRRQQEQTGAAQP